MAYVAPTTKSTGTLITAAIWNQDIVDNQNAAFPLGAGVWTDFIPTLTQSATVTKTVTYARYFMVGKLVVANVRLSVTGTGTAGNNVVFGLPVTAASNNGRPWGTGEIFDSSAVLLYHGVAISLSTTTIGIRATTGSAGTLLGTASFTAALASGDDIGYSVMYEAA